MCIVSAPGPRDRLYMYPDCTPTRLRVPSYQDYGERLGILQADDAHPEPRCVSVRGIVGAEEYRAVALALYDFRPGTEIEVHGQGDHPSMLRFAYLRGGGQEIVRVHDDFVGEERNRHPVEIDRRIAACIGIDVQQLAAKVPFGALPLHTGHLPRATDTTSLHARMYARRGH